jgi:colanic acid/amylovoran biosynthesis glycosyltransferase
MSIMTSSRKLRLAFLLPSFPALSNTFVNDQITGMLNRGHQVDLFTPSPKNFTVLPPALQSFGLEQRMRHLPVPSGRVARLASAARLLSEPGGLNRAYIDALNPWGLGKQALSLVQLHTAASFARSGPYDVLHCHFGHLGIFGERLVRSGAVDAALVTAFRGADLAAHYPRNPKRFSALFRQGDLHLPVSADFERRLIAAGVPPDRVTVHHDGIDTRSFAFEERRPLDGLTKILFVGRLVEKKGVAYALDAMVSLVRSGRKVQLTIIGDGPLEPTLRARSEELGLAEHVVFAGARSHDQVALMMRRFHIFLAPSVTAASGDQEGIPTVIKEAMATGMPVVSTFHTGIPELVGHGVTGYLAPERDAESLAKQMIALLDHPAQWSEMGRAGRRRVEEEFDTDKLNDTLVERYREAMAQRRANGTRHP